MPSTVFHHHHHRHIISFCYNAVFIYILILYPSSSKQSRHVALLYMRTVKHRSFGRNLRGCAGVGYVRYVMWRWPQKTHKVRAGLWIEGNFLGSDGKLFWDICCKISTEKWRKYRIEHSSRRLFVHFTISLLTKYWNVYFSFYLNFIENMYSVYIKKWF